MFLKRDCNLHDPDGVYGAIIEAHRDLSEKESAALNARLVLLLANHVGDQRVIEEAIRVAHASGSGTATP